jgi:type II secretory pathway pseudopilin PulG
LKYGGRRFQIPVMMFFTFSSTNHFIRIVFMKYRARLFSSVCVTISATLCLAALFYSTTHVVTRAHAEQASTTESVSSSPSSGPVGATISVSGSGWPEPVGEQVTLGYMIAAFCSTVPNSQASTFKSGSFSGSLHLPNGTPLGTYQICANFGSTTAVANTTYTVLTESSPQISVSLPIQQRGQQATVSGSNYLPSGTTVNLYWETTNGNVIFTITPAVSNSSGLISRIFLIPTSMVSGPYKIVATVSGQPALTSSAAFTYSAPTPTPTPTPSPTALPASDPTPTKHVSPTAVATTTITTPTSGATSIVGSQNTGQTPSGTTTSNDSHTNQVSSIVLIGSITGVFAILAIILIIVLFIRRKKARSQQIAAEVGSTQNSQMSWQNSQFGSTPYPINNGSMAVSPPWPSASSSPPQQLQISPYAHLLQQDEGGTPPTSEPSKLTPDDPNLESIKQQVQMGLFATSANHRDD